MLSVPNSRRVALLIDADQIPLSRLNKILKFSESCGNLKICRAYGDWKQPPLCNSVANVRHLKIEWVQVDRIAKDTTDKKLMIEAVEILCASKVDTFIIASGDGDFRLLCEWIQKKGRQVIGIGNKGHTSVPLQEFCHAFYYVEDLERHLSSLGKLKDR